jgi:hypothetical protein
MAYSFSLKVEVDGASETLVIVYPGVTSLTVITLGLEKKNLGIAVGDTRFLKIDDTKST